METEALNTNKAKIDANDLIEIEKLESVFEAEYNFLKRKLKIEEVRNNNEANNWIQIKRNRDL